ncbi:MAG: hypothetical protein SVU32_04110 [Candidatus Nanohaloarchaea archaeon]|nr:hypothetical protein [Candidatus Nanohaloarchaea archaeon]
MKDSIDREQIKDSSRLESIAEQGGMSEDEDDPGLAAQYGLEDRDGTEPVIDETDWLLGELAAHQDTDYSEIPDSLEELGTMIVQPDAISLTEDIDGDISSSRRSKYTWNSDQSKGGIREQDDGLFKWIYDFRLKESDVEGEDVLKQNENLKILDSIIQGTNALKWQEDVKIHGSVLQGENLLQQSKDVEAAGSALYGRETMHYVDEVRVVDSFVAGENPMAYSLGDNDGRIEIYNSIIMGDSLMHEQRNVTVRDSILMGNEILEEGKADLQNTYLVRDGTVEYYEDSTIKGYSTHSSTEPDKEWGLIEHS